MDQASCVSSLLPVAHQFCLSSLLSSSFPFFTTSLVTDHTPFLFITNILFFIFVLLHAMRPIVGSNTSPSFYVFFFTINKPPHPNPTATCHIPTCSSHAPPNPAPSPSPPPGEGGDGGLEQQDPEDNRLWAGPRVAPHHQDECCRHLRLDVARSHPLIHVLQG